MKKTRQVIDSILIAAAKDLEMMTGDGCPQVKYGIIVVNSAPGGDFTLEDEQLTDDDKKSPEIEEK